MSVYVCVAEGWERCVWRQSLKSNWSRCRRQSPWTNVCGLTTEVKPPSFVWSAERAIFKMEMKRCYTHPQLLSKEDLRGPGRAKKKKKNNNSRLDRPTVGEASALPSFKVRLTKRKRSARFIQRRLLMVGRQKVLHMILPGAPGTLQLHFSTLLFIPSTCPPPPAEGATLPPATPAHSLSLSLSHLISLYFPEQSLLLHVVSQDQRASFSTSSF